MKSDLSQAYLLCPRQSSRLFCLSSSYHAGLVRVIPHHPLGSRPRSFSPLLPHLTTLEFHPDTKMTRRRCNGDDDSMPPTSLSPPLAATPTSRLPCALTPFRSSPTFLMWALRRVCHRFYPWVCAQRPRAFADDATNLRRPLPNADSDAVSTTNTDDSTMMTRVTSTTTMTSTPTMRGPKCGNDGSKTCRHGTNSAAR